MKHTYKIVMLSIMVCCIHSNWGASEIDVSGKEAEMDAKKDKIVLTDPAGANENLNTIIAQSCLYTRGNGDL
jgi:hypothetical protein